MKSGKKPNKLQAKESKQGCWGFLGFFFFDDFCFAVKAIKEWGRIAKVNHIKRNPRALKAETIPCLLRTLDIKFSGEKQKYYLEICNPVCCPRT